MSTDYRPPWFKFYPRDFLLSKKVRAMTWEERGLYIYLLSEQWDSEDCTLPVDQTALSHLVGYLQVTIPERVMACFVEVEGAPKIFNPRLREIWLEHNELRDAQSRGGKKSAKTRAYNSKTLPKTLSKTQPKTPSGKQSQNQRQNKDLSPSLTPPHPGKFDGSTLTPEELAIAQKAKAETEERRRVMDSSGDEEWGSVGKIVKEVLGG